VASSVHSLSSFPAFGLVFDTCIVCTSYALQTSSVYISIVDPLAVCQVHGQCCGIVAYSVQVLLQRVNVQVKLTSVHLTRCCVAVDLSHQAVCGDGVCDDSEIQVYREAATASTCEEDCPYVARSCPYPGSLAVSDPLQVGHQPFDRQQVRLHAAIHLIRAHRIVQRRLCCMSSCGRYNTS
jgi:hypothetical protein